MLPGNTPVVVADTVGFIRELPHELVAAFQSTLTEAREATLLLHVVDVSDPRRDEHIDEVNRVLAEIGAADLPQILVFNKIDRIDTPPRVERDESGKREPRLAVRGEGRWARSACASRSPSAWRAWRGVRRCACRCRPANCGRGCMPANLVLAERIAEDGAFEIDTELSEFELLKWAREPGVEVLTLDERLNLYGRRCLPTIVARLAKQLIWPGINPVIRTTTLGARNRPPAVAISTRPSRTGRSASNRCSAAAAGGSATPLLFIGIVDSSPSGWPPASTRCSPATRAWCSASANTSQTVGDGWGWRLPWPIETVTKVDVAGVKSIDYKSRVLTAEPNMVELQVAVQYRITSAEDYLFKVRDPSATLGEVSESAIREVVGRNDQQAILEAGRIKIAEDTRVIMQRTLDQYGAGIEVRSVNITDVQVPEAVQQAQRDSVKAKADRERMIKEAQAYANGILPKAEGDAARAVQEAEAYKSQVGARWPPATPRASRSWHWPMKRRRT